MKKLLFITLLFAAVQSTNAQLLSVGAKAGISSSKVKWDQNFTNVNGSYSFNSGDNQLGWHAGLWLRVKVPLLGLYVQPEFLYTQLGGNVNVNFDTTGIPQSGNAKFKFQRFDIPVMVGWKFTALRLFVGPVFSFNLAAEQDFLGAVEDIKDNYQSSTVGWQGGVGLDLGRIQIDGKYEGNLSKFSKQVKDISGFEPDQRTQQWILSLGYKF